jgi:hypothetical protein
VGDDYARLSGLDTVIGIMIWLSEKVTINGPLLGARKCNPPYI